MIDKLKLLWPLFKWDGDAARTWGEMKLSDDSVMRVEVKKQFNAYYSYCEKISPKMELGPFSDPMVALKEVFRVIGRGSLLDAELAMTGQSATPWEV